MCDERDVASVTAALREGPNILLTKTVIPAPFKRLPREPKKLHPANDNNIFNSGTNYFLFNKKGGAIYKAKLTKRTKDNDRTARSIESSKKIAAKFLEKAIDSLYTYDQVELIAKPKKKRKY